MRQLEQAQWKCPICERVTVHSRYVRGCNHTLHFLVSLLVCGLWLPIWAYDAIREGASAWTCIECGNEQGKAKITPPAPPKPKRKKGGDDDLPRGEVVGGWGNLE